MRVRVDIHIAFAFPDAYWRGKPPSVAGDLPMETGTAGVTSDGKDFRSVKDTRFQHPQHRGIICPTRPCAVAFVELLTTLNGMKTCAVSRKDMEG